MICEGCVKVQKCTLFWKNSDVILECSDYKKSLTNADRIRMMTEEEMCDEYFEIFFHVLPRYTHSRLGLLEWLKQETDYDPNQRTNTEQLR